MKTESPEMEILSIPEGKTISKMSVTRVGLWLQVFIDFDDGTCVDISSEKGSWPEIIYGRPWLRKVL